MTNYYKQKKKYEILNQKKKEEKEGQEWLKHIKETSDQYNKIKKEFYRDYLKNSLYLKHKGKNKTQLLTTKVLEKEG